MPAEEKIKYYEVRARYFDEGRWRTVLKTHDFDEANEEFESCDLLNGHDTYHRLVKVKETVLKEY